MHLSHRWELFTHRFIRIVGHEDGVVGLFEHADGSRVAGTKCPHDFVHRGVDRPIGVIDASRRFAEDRLKRLRRLDTRQVTAQLFDDSRRVETEVSEDETGMVGFNGDSAGRSVSPKVVGRNAGQQSIDISDRQTSRSGDEWADGLR